MKQLIKSQRIRIDDHSRGMAVGHFDDDEADIHLDKEAVSGKYRIRVPLNTNRPVNVEIRGERDRRNEIPENIAREVREAFADVNKRRAFVEDLVTELHNYVHRIQNEVDLKYVYSVLPYFSEDFVSKIKQSVPGEALIFGSCVPMPLQVKVPRANPDPDSDNCKITEEWFKDGYRNES